MVYRFGTRDIEYISKAVGRIHSTVARDFREIINLQSSPSSILNFALLSYRRCLHSCISELSKQYEADFIIPAKLLIAYEISNNNSPYRDTIDFMNIDKINIFGNSRIYSTENCNSSSTNNIRFYISIIEDMSSFLRGLSSSAVSIVAEVKDEDGNYSFGLSFYYDYILNDYYTSVGNQLYCNNIKHHISGGFSKLPRNNLVKFYNNKFINNQNLKDAFFDIVKKFSYNTATYNLNGAILELIVNKVDAVICYYFEDKIEFLASYHPAKFANIIFYDFNGNKVDLDQILRDKKFIATRVST